MKGGRDRLTDGPKAMKTQGRRALMPMGKSANIWCQYPLSPVAIFQAIVSLLWIIWEWISESKARQGSLIKVMAEPPGMVLAHPFSCALRQAWLPVPRVAVQLLPPHRHVYTPSHCEICPDFPSLNSSLLNFNPLFIAISLWTRANDNSVELTCSPGVPQCS